MMHWTPPAGVAARWQPELDALAPRTTRGHGWLKLVWEPGESWEPIGRWVVYEMHPLERAPFDIADQLRGINPRRLSRWDRVLGRMVASASSLITQRQWWLYQDTGCFGRPIWIVQGRNGGHKRRWTDIEQTVIQMATGIEEFEPPPVGELCYAEPDMRTLKALRGLDMVDRFGDILKVIKHDGALRDGLDFREREVAETMALQLWHWLDEQVEEALEFTRAQVAEIWEHASDEPIEMDEDAQREDFVRELSGV